MAHQITLIPGDGIGPEIFAVMMLEYLDELKAAKRIEQAVARVIEKGEKVTKDINPHKFVGTAEFADAVIEELL